MPPRPNMQGNGMAPNGMQPPMQNSPYGNNMPPQNNMGGGQPFGGPQPPQNNMGQNMPPSNPMGQPQQGYGQQPNGNFGNNQMQPPQNNMGMNRGPIGQPPNQMQQQPQNNMMQNRQPMGAPSPMGQQNPMGQQQMGQQPGSLNNMQQQNPNLGNGALNQNVPQSPVQTYQSPPLKSLQTASVAAWCPVAAHPTLMALGTSHLSVPAIGNDFSYQQEQNKLEFVKFEMADSSDKIASITSIATNEKFLSLSWGAKNLDPNNFPYGILAAAMADGTINMYNPAVILQSNGQEQGLIWSSTMCAEFNNTSLNPNCCVFHPSKPNVVAVAGPNCEVNIIPIDVNNPSQTEPLKTHGATKMKGEIVNLAWNNQVGGILSSAASNGVIAIWDLKSKSTAAQLQDPSHRQHITSRQLNWGWE